MSTRSINKKAFALFLMLLTTAFGITGCGSSTKCVNFEAPLTVGTQYGSPAGQTPGTIIFTVNNIAVSVHDFTYTNGGGTFNFAKIDNALATFGSGQIMRTNNINLEFDFRQLGFTPSKVELRFLDMGGFENLAVNGLPVPIYAGELSSAPVMIGSVAVSITTTPVTGGKVGTLSLTGQINTLRIGGQEFWIDEVCASN